MSRARVASTRRNEKRTPSRQPRRRRRTLRWLLGVVVVLALSVVGVQWALHQPFLRVQHVTVEGLHHETLAQVLRASGLDSHPTMISVTSQQIERRLRVFPWVDGVTLIKHWPNSLTLSVHEGSAVAVAFSRSHQLDFVSAQGRDLGPAPLRANLPTLVFHGPATSSWPFSSVARASARVASLLPRAFSAQVALISENAAGDVDVKLTTPVTFELGSPTNLHSKFVAIASVIAHSTLAAGDVVDVTVPSELAVTAPG